MEHKLLRMAFEEINPFVRFVQIINISKNSFPHWIKSYDCRLFYVQKGNGIIYIEDKEYYVSPGDLVLWQPNAPYHMEPDINNQTFTMITSNFDFTRNYAHILYPQPPERIESYDPNSLNEIIQFTNFNFLNQHIYIKNMHHLESFLLEMVKEFKTQKNYYNLRLNGLMLSVIGYIARSYVLPSQYSTTTSINLIIEYIHNNYMNDITNTNIGEALNFHPNYINKLMVLNTGNSLHQYLLNYRISKAIELIESTSDSIADIAFQVGFKDISHFSKYFKKKTGRIPRAFRRH